MELTKQRNKMADKGFPSSLILNPGEVTPFQNKGIPSGRSLQIATM